MKRPGASVVREVLATASELVEAGTWVATALSDAVERVRQARDRVAAPLVEARLDAVATGRAASGGESGGSESGRTDQSGPNHADQLRRAITDSVQVLPRSDADDADSALVTAAIFLADLTAAARPLRRFVADVLPVLRRDLPLVTPLERGATWGFTPADRKMTALDAWPRVEGVVRWASAHHVADLIERVRAVAAAPPSATAAWERFRGDEPAFASFVASAAGLRLDAAAAVGVLPQDTLDQIDAYYLNESLLRAPLRRYQSFGARFALTQRRAIVADEMGLGKSVQALAAMADLAARDPEARFLVVCPAGAVASWVEMISTHTSLPVQCLDAPTSLDAHTPDTPTPAGHPSEPAPTSSDAHAAAASGGVAVTTYGALETLDLPADQLALLVVDEAHYLKNPETPRARRVRDLGRRADRVLYLTGAPLEQRPDEMDALKQLLEPSGDASYLRRTAADVLTELPGLTRVDAWERFSTDDLEHYREAVAAGNFSQMRRAAFASGDPRTSAKFARLLELVNESRKNGRKVVVFSHFLGVLAMVASTLDAHGFPTFGPLTSATTRAQREELIEGFRAHDGHAVLVVQIEKADADLTLDAASVAIIVEPQVDATREDRAIEHVRRPGSADPTLVYRLLVEDSVDARMLETRAAQREHALSEPSLAKAVIAVERAALFGSAEPH